MGDLYEYESGEDYYGKDDPEFGAKADAAYENVDAALDAEKPISWSKLCTDYFGLEVPDNTDKPIWIQHVGARNAMKNAINYRAALYCKRWRLYISTHGETLIKKADRQMVETEISGRLRGVANSYKRMKNNLRPIIGVDGISRRDRALLESMVSMVEGAQVSTIGLIAQMTLPKKLRLALLEHFDLSFNQDEDDEL